MEKITRFGEADRRFLALTCAPLNEENEILNTGFLLYKILGGEKQRICVYYERFRAGGVSASEPMGLFSLNELH